MTHPKIPITGTGWDQNLNRALAVLEENHHFLFSAYPDADALGTMLALALYLNQIDKQATLFLPHPVGRHLHVLKEIIRYNDIQVLTEAQALRSLGGQVDTVVFCDTAHSRLIPCFSWFRDAFLDRKVQVIEIDHHFGNDSAAIAPDGIHLFRHANSSTEIAAQLLQAWHRNSPNLPAPFEFRNIALSLLMGLQADTFGGQAAQVPEDYDSWNRLLATGLELPGSGEKPLSVGNGHRFRRPEEILEDLNRLSPDQRQCVEELKGKIIRHRGVGELNLLDSTLAHLSREPIKNGNGEFFQIWNAMANVVPKVGGKIGLFYFNGTNAEGEDCVFVKLRRAFDFHRFDLRESENLLKSSFGDHFQGGGGHAMAVSFRIHPMREPDFRARIPGLITHLQEKIE